MAHLHVASDLERLPWLADDTQPVGKGDLRPLVGWAVGASLIVAAVSYWVGSTAARLSAGPDSAVRPSATVALPETASAPEPELQQPEFVAPSMEPVAPPPQAELPKAAKIAPQQPVTAPQQQQVTANAQADTSGTTDATADAEAAPAAEAEQADSAPARKQPISYWPSIESTGAAGRMVRIGTFASRLQAKRAWWRITRVYPGMRTLNAVVAPLPSLRNGRTYYRLQFGTTSHAHSTILCQRMRIVGQSCVIVGAPGQAAGSA